MYGEGDAAKKQQPTGTTHDILKKAPFYGTSPSF